MGNSGEIARVEGGRIVSRLRTYLHMFAQRARMSIRLVASRNSTIVRLVGGVDVTVLLAVAAVREAPLATRVFTLERFLAWKKKTGINDFVIESGVYVSTRWILN